MQILDPGFTKPADLNSTDEFRADVNQSLISDAQKAELEQYRAVDPNYKKSNQALNQAKHQVNEEKALNIQDIVEAKTDSRQVNQDNSSDKLIIKENDRVKIFKKVDTLASYTAIFTDIAGAFMELVNLPEKFKTKMNKLVDCITNLSFIPYGLDGMRRAFFENKNPYMFLGFLFELSMVWKSNLKNKYLIRGAGTATDQIWIATQHKLADKDPVRFKEGKFKTWQDGLIETPKACWQMLIDIAKKPIKVLSTIDKEKGSYGYYALLSSIGSFSATVGYLITGNEKLFGSLRDVSGVLFDWEMLLDKLAIRKFSGALFIAESALDFAAKFIEDSSTRLFVNKLSLAAGRQALQLYKNSNESQENNKNPKQTPDNNHKVANKRDFAISLAV